MIAQARPTRIERETDVYVVMARCGSVANQLRFSPVDRTKAEIIVLELARNILSHANGNGDITIEAVEEGARTGLLITASDRGPGIANVSAALQDGYSTAGTLGAGLPGVQRMADRCQIETTIGEGTTVRAWKWRAAERGRI